MIPGRTIDVQYALSALKRRRYWLLVPALAFTALAVLIAVRMQNLYYSQTVILIVPQTVPAAYVPPTVNQPIEARLRTIGEQIRSHSRLARIILELNLYPEARQTTPMEAVVLMMNDSIVLQTGRGDSFTLGFTYPQPQLAAAVTTRLAKMYIEENLTDRSRQADGTSAFLERELEESRRRLVVSEKKLEAYRQKYAGQLPTQVTSNLQVIASTQQQIQALADASNRHRDQRTALLQRIADAEATPVPPPVIPAGPANAGGSVGSAAQQLESAQRELAAAMGRLTPSHPDIVRLKRRIAELEPKVQAEISSRPDVSGRPPQTAAELAAQNRLRDLRAQLTTIDHQIATSEADDVRLRHRVAEYQARIDASPARESELSDLTRDYAILQRTYQDLLAKKESSQLAASLEKGRGGEQFKVLDAARVPEQPAKPNRPLIVAGGLIAGLVVGFLLAAGVEIRDSTLRTQDDVISALQLPMLAQIPQMVTSFDTSGRGRLWKRVAVALLLVAMGAGWWVFRAGSVG